MNAAMSDDDHDPALGFDDHGREIRLDDRSLRTRYRNPSPKYPLALTSPRPSRLGSRNTCVGRRLQRRASHPHEHHVYAEEGS